MASLSLDWIVSDRGRGERFREYLVDNEASEVDLGRLDFITHSKALEDRKDRDTILQFKTNFVDNNVGYFNNPNIKTKLKDEFG